MFNLETEGQGHGVQHLQWSQSMINVNLYKSHNLEFFADSHSFRDIHILEFVSLKI